ncbi:FG-GAP repeat domain-containing protein [Arundinibacter roseus]|uniref:VCBS repeat-containing protein n=1 Tax=Arundinibacter roseus TaxID=2070510 RepID=A0A4R4K8H1_9BACT|nr:VCBS repeat-containing protein [Arundinibacter roseus]TDB63987.1 VCBS repeat-containing protein [Arundinibacter roseus]
MNTPLTLRLASLLLFSQVTAVFAQNPTFKAEVIDAKISIGYGLATGDVDGDGRLDVLMADQKEIVWYQNPGSAGSTWVRHVLAANLTERDNVCIAARDIDGDGKVEVAVGAQWNPGETRNANESGAVFYLIPPADRTARWEPVRLHHEVTIHRMHWVQDSDGAFQLMVLPLHGEGNEKGEGKAVQLIAFDVPQNPKGLWAYQLVDTGMHMTHNMEPMEVKGAFLGMAVAGKEGVQVFLKGVDGWAASGNWMVLNQGVGEIRTGKLGTSQLFTTTIEPMHGNSLVVYTKDARAVLTDRLNQGHALVTGDFLGLGRDQIVMGWREKNPAEQVGVRLYMASDPAGSTWQEYALDEKVNMACEDIRAADLDGDGDLDLVAAGRATKNVVIYWNKRIP